MSSGSNSAEIYRFGVFEVLPRAGELQKSGVRVKLQEQPFQLLVFLLENAGEIVSRESVRQRLWQGNTFVDFDASLSVAVGKLREALGDSADNPRFIETVPRRGYRFIAPVTVVEKTLASQSVAAPTVMTQHPSSQPQSVSQSEQLNSDRSVSAFRQKRGHPTQGFGPRRRGVGRRDCRVAFVWQETRDRRQDNARRCRPSRTRAPLHRGAWLPKPARSSR